MRRVVGLAHDRLLSSMRTIAVAYCKTRCACLQPELLTQHAMLRCTFHVEMTQYEQMAVKQDDGASDLLHLMRQGEALQLRVLLPGSFLPLARMLLRQAGAARIGLTSSFRQLHAVLRRYCIPLSRRPPAQVSLQH